MGRNLATVFFRLTTAICKRLSSQVLLSYPDETDPNVITVKNSTGHVVFESQIEEKILHPEMNKTDVVPPFNAYASPGDVEVTLISHTIEYRFLFLKCTTDWKILFYFNIFILNAILILGRIGVCELRYSR